MATHTPGPWRMTRNLQDGHSFNITADDDESLFVRVLGTPGMAEANAHLIVAAPELLTAAVAALAQLRATYANAVPNFASLEDTALADGSETGQLLLAAIAKAGAA